MPVVEARVDREKLAEVLAEASESEAVEWKARGDLNDRQVLVDLAAEVAAMQLRPDGGYVVLGLADDGTVLGLGDAEVRLLDPAIIGDKLRRYLTQTEVLVAIHEVEDDSGDRKRVALLYVHPSRDALAVFEADGTYPGPDGGQRVRFRKGDVFARHGTKSERWNQADIAQVRRRIRSQEREQWAAEIRADLPNLGLAAEAQRLADAPAAALIWQMDGATFEQTVIEQLRRGDEIPLTLLLTSMPRDASELLTRPDGQEPLSVLLDRLACLGATALVIDRPALLDRAAQTLWAIYLLGLDEHGVSRGGLAVPAPVLFLAVLVRVMALGALAVRMRRWPEVRQLVLRRGQGYEWIPGRIWLTHASVMAARSDLLVKRTASGATETLSVIALARREIERLACLRPDHGAGDEAILDSLCQFDLAANLILIDDEGGPGRGGALHFARFYTTRSEPLVLALIEGGSARQALFPRPDDELANVLRVLGEQAGQQAWRYAGWDGFEDQRILRFLQAHPPPVS